MVKMKLHEQSMKGNMQIGIIFLILCEGVLSLYYECTLPSQTEVGLGVANCSSQQLLHVPANLPHNIKVLDLSNNSISYLADYSFYKYEYLEILHLRNNSLTFLETQTFSQQKKLLYLDLSYNNLDLVPSDTFKDLKSLLTLSLAGNKIRSIQSNSFKDVTKLMNLYLSGNHIELIYPDAFQGLTNLQRLELQNNALNSLNSSTLRFFTSNLKEIKLYNNPWYCDCNLRMLVQWLRNSSSSDMLLQWKFNSAEPFCKGPSLLHDRMFSSLTMDSFLCPIRMYSKARNIETSKGSNINLICKYMADPPVEIQWLKNGNLLELNKSRKYSIEAEGEIIVTNTLHVYNFQYEDIGEYKCFAENKLGEVSDSCMVTLVGIDPLSVLLSDKTKTKDDEKERVRNAIIASSAVGGFVVILIVTATILCVLTRCKHHHRKKKESIRMSFEEHLKANGVIECNEKDEPMLYDVPVIPDNSLSMDENESVYNSLQRPKIHSSTNTNTYCSFQTDFSESEDMTSLCAQRQQTSNHSKGSDGSQCESTSPLLENMSSILIDRHDPFYEANLYVPHFYAPTNNYSVMPQRDYSDKGFIIPQDKKDFISSLDDSGLIMSRHPNNYISTRTKTLPHNGHVIYRDGHMPRDPHCTRTLPHGCTPGHMIEYSSTPVVRSNSSVTANGKCASVGHLYMSPPKKPPRIFSSHDTVSLHSQTSFAEPENRLKLSLPKPGIVDKYGTAV